MLRRSLIALLPISLLVTQSHLRAQTAARTYAVVSLVGDALDVVTTEIATGSRLDRNIHQSVPVVDGSIDRAALLAVQTSLKKSAPTAQVMLFAPTSPRLFEHQESFFDGARAALPAELADPVRKEGATHLLLITKFRADANLKVLQGSLGAGKISGLGFFVDRSMRIRNTDTQETARGFLAPFVSVKASLIDLQTQAVVHEAFVTESYVLSAARATGGVDPWEVMTAAEKAQTLRDALSAQLERVVPQLVATP